MIICLYYMLINFKKNVKIINMKNGGSMYKKAFTLAEVLIVIGIIGVLAVILIPNIVENCKEKEYITQLKKVYSTLTKSYQSSLTDYGETYNWSLDAADSTEGANRLNDILISNLRIIKNCRTDGGCWLDTEINYLDNTSTGLNVSNNSAYSTVFLEGGVLLALRVLDPTCNLVMGTSDNYKHVCAEVIVDLNGEKNPNTFGYDVHKLYISRRNIIPAGYSEDTVTSFANNCEGRTKGTGCAAWILQWSNMDYLHCSGLSWGGKNKCKAIFNYEYSQL